MKKTDKKIDNSLRDALTEVCEIVLGKVEGFVWLTHLVNYSSFPNSLNIVCVFDTYQSLNNAKKNQQDEYLYQLINEQLIKVNIKLKPISQVVSFDTEEACGRFNGGKWSERLQKVT